MVLGNINRLVAGSIWLVADKTSRGDKGLIWRVAGRCSRTKRGETGGRLLPWAQGQKARNL